MSDLSVAAALAVLAAVFVQADMLLPALVSVGWMGILLAVHFQR